MLRALAAVLLAGGVCLGTATAQELPFTHFASGGQPPTALPSASVQKFIQDSEGYIWLAFYTTGVARYDGRSMETYDVRDGLADPTVREIVEDATGHLWVASEGGLAVSQKPLAAYRPGERLRFVSAAGNVQLTRSRMRRNCVVALPDGWVWVGTQNGILRYRFDRTGKLEEQGVPGSVPVLAMFARRDGTVIAGRGDGEIVSYSGDTARRIARSDSPASAFAETPDGKIWGGSVNGAVWRLDGDVARVVGHELAERIVSVLATRDGRHVWAASLGSGAVRIDRADPSQRMLVTRANGLLGETLWSMLEDREGNLWFAQNGGASRLRKGYEAFSSWTERSFPALPDSSTFAVLPSWNGAMWVATGSGLAAMTADATTTLTVDHSLHSNQIYAVAPDARGRLWLGTSAGLNCLSPAGSEPPAVNGVTQRRPVTINGTRYVLSALGLDTTYNVRSFNDTTCFAGAWGAGCLSGDRWYLFRAAAGLSAAGATSIATDAQGYLWIGSLDRGLFRTSAPLAELLQRLPPGEVMERVLSPVWTTRHGAQSDSVRSLLPHRGSLWIGSGAGLSVVSTTAPFSAKNVLEGQPVVGMTPSRDGRSVWVSNNAGLVEIDAATLRELSRVTKADGLVDDEAWAYGPLATDATGRIYLGTPSGVSVFNPEARQKSTLPPIVRLRRVTIGEENAIELEYAGLSYIDESRIRYQTRLAGFDRNWSGETADAKTRYTNLPAYLFARVYTFEVKARSADGIWSEPLAYRFTVQPPLWLRWWAVLAYVAALAVALLWSNRWRTRQLKRKNRVLEDLVMARTEEIRAQAREMETVDRMVEVINREVVFENVLKSILDQGMRLFPQAEKGAFLKFDHETRRTEVVAVSGYDPEQFRGVSLSFEEAMRRYSERAEQLEEGVYLIKHAHFRHL
ncbi:MAG TPA: two-component regulator propeller domain-containing protein, partial [Thermoanaerobaculia bacterium]|nr:two-component regulator propeller domain-containing protein [Thermoanaerobaculia bacterium]